MDWRLIAEWRRSASKITPHTKNEEGPVAAFLPHRKRGLESAGADRMAGMPASIDPSSFHVCGLLWQ
jgi:hypothetical protein